MFNVTKRCYVKERRFGDKVFVLAEVELAINSDTKNFNVVGKETIEPLTLILEMLDRIWL